MLVGGPEEKVLRGLISTVVTWEERLGAQTPSVALSLGHWRHTTGHSGSGAEMEGEVTERTEEVLVFFSHRYQPEDEVL